MIRGKPAQFKFKLPCTFSEVESAKIAFWQPYNSGPSVDRPLPIIKTLAQCSPIDDKQDEMLVVLDKEETLRFSDDRKAYAQLSGVSFDGMPILHKKYEITVYPVYDALLSDDIPPIQSDDGLIYLDGGNIV